MSSCALAYVFALNMSNNKLASKILPLKYIMLLLAKIVFFVHLFKKMSLVCIKLLAISVVSMIVFTCTVISTIRAWPLENWFYHVRCFTHSLLLSVSQSH